MSKYNPYIELVLPIPEDMINPANECGNPLIEEIKERLYEIIDANIKHLPKVKQKYVILFLQGKKIYEIAQATNRSNGNVCHALWGDRLKSAKPKPGAVQHLQNLLYKNEEVKMLLMWIKEERERDDG